MAGRDPRRKEVDLKVLQGLKGAYLNFKSALIMFQGLGSSEDSDGRDYFSHMGKHMIPFAPTQEGDRELIDLAFSKKKADERKEWLRQFKVT
jgi:C-terminal associated domain of TOPRIM